MLNIDKQKCDGCKLCGTGCPFGAIELQEGRFGTAAHVNPAQCKGCGCCVASCPSGAMQQKGFNDKQLMSMISALTEEMTGGAGG